MAVGTYEKGQVVVMSVHRSGGLTLDVVAHLIQPPGFFSMVVN